MSIHTCIPVGCVGCFDEAEALRAERDALKARVAESESVIRELRQKLAIAGVEGSPPPGEDTTIGALLARAHAAEAALKVEREAHAATEAARASEADGGSKWMHVAQAAEARERGLRAALENLANATAPLIEQAAFWWETFSSQVGVKHVLIEAARAALAAPAGDGHVCSMLTPKRDCPVCRGGR